MARLTKRVSKHTPKSFAGFAPGANLIKILEQIEFKFTLEIVCVQGMAYLKAKSEYISATSFGIMTLSFMTFGITIKMRNSA